MKRIEGFQKEVSQFCNLMDKTINSFDLSDSNISSIMNDPNYTEDLLGDFDRMLGATSILSISLGQSPEAKKMNYILGILTGSGLNLKSFLSEQAVQDGIHWISNLALNTNSDETNILPTYDEFVIEFLYWKLDEKNSQTNSLYKYKDVKVYIEAIFNRSIKNLFPEIQEIESTVEANKPKKTNSISTNKVLTREAVDSLLLEPGLVPTDLKIFVEDEEENEENETTHDSKIIRPSNSLLQSKVKEFQDAMAKTLSKISHEEVSCSLLSTDLLNGKDFFTHNHPPYDIQFISSNTYNKGFYFIQNPNLVFGILNQQMAGSDRPFTSIMGKELTILEKRLNEEVFREVYLDFKNIFGDFFHIGSFNTIIAPPDSYSNTTNKDDDIITVSTFEVTAEHYYGTFMLALPYTDSLLKEPTTDFLQVSNENPQTISSLLPLMEIDNALKSFNSLPIGVKAEVLFRIYHNNERMILPLGKKILFEVFSISENSKKFNPKSYVKDLIKMQNEEEQENLKARLKEKDPDIEL